MGFASTRDFIDETCRDAFGDAATVTPNDGGDAYSLTGIYVRKYHEDDEGYVAVNVAKEYFDCLAKDAIGRMKKGYAIECEGYSFTVKDIKPPLETESIEWVLLGLER